MSDEEYERFEINDYDLQNEFNPNRNRRRPTKNQQIYGIWADNDSDEEAPTKSRAGRGAPNYTAPVNFVAGGIQQAGDKETKAKEESTHDEDSPRPTNSSSESEKDEAGDEPQFSWSRKMPKPANQYPGNIAQWEKHTTGIGSKLLLKMGYEPGRGLGKNLQGISTPIQAHVRKGRGAIGAYGTESGLTLADQKPAKKVDEDERETKEFKEKLQHWRKDGADRSKSKKFRYFYKTADDVLKEKSTMPGRSTSALKSNDSKMNQVTVIDMTGPEKRVLSGYHALGQCRPTTEGSIKEIGPTNFALPELMHNLNLIVNICEQDIISNDGHLRSIQDQSVTLQKTRENLEGVIELEHNHIQQMERTFELVDSLVNPKEELCLSEAERIFLQLQTDLAQEFEEFELADLVPGIIAPLVNAELKEWDPLAQPTQHMDILRRWRQILHQTNINSDTLFEPYSALVWSGIVPSVRKAVTNWNPVGYQDMVQFLDAWAPYFPQRILDNILEQMILPRISTAVDNWDPLTDHIPIHIWIHPWIGLLRDKLGERVYPMIREKLGNALVAWYPQDRSALAMLKPWKSNFNDVELQQFLVRHIVPKLQAVLHELIINPLQQDLEPWNQVWEWHELLTAQTMAQLLDSFFFPKWMQTLVIWLNQNPNLEQVARWYAGWKAMLSQDVQEELVIKNHFRRALELMHRASGIEPQIQVPPPPPQLAEMGRPPTIPILQIPPPIIEFKELVAQKCADRGIIFAPMPGRRELGKQVYRFGKLFCYIDRTVIMLGDGTFNNWAPVSLAVALERGING